MENFRRKKYGEKEKGEKAREETREEAQKGEEAWQEEEIASIKNPLEQSSGFFY